MTEAQLISIVNQLFEIEKKTTQHNFDKINRNVERLKSIIEDLGILYKNPTGEKYDETRIDCSATLLEDGDNLIIHDTMKPIIYRKKNNQLEIIQQARVIVK
jgi:hypothetical protein